MNFAQIRGFLATHESQNMQDQDSELNFLEVLGLSQQIFEITTYSVGCSSKLDDSSRQQGAPKPYPIYPAKFPPAHPILV